MNKDAMFQKIVERIANAIVEGSVELPADRTISEEARGIHALHLLQILATARSHAPPDAEGLVVSSPPILDTIHFHPIEPLQATPSKDAKPPKPAKPAKTKPVRPPKAKQWGREIIFSPAMIDAALDKSGGVVAPAAIALDCSAHNNL